MHTTSLPSGHKKSTSEDIERTPEIEPEDPEQSEPGGAARKISPTALSWASQCLLRGLWTVEGVPAIGPSPFTQAAFDDGRAFEKVLVEPQTNTLWIRAINLAMGTTLPGDLRITKGRELKVGAGETAPTFTNRVREQFAKLLPLDKSVPFALHEAMLASEEAGAALRGKPDLLIWTGGRWIIADIKCSEEARRTHGIQIAAYARMLSQMRPGETIDPRGVVIHCAAGYRFTADSSEADREVALSHTLATPFPIAALAPVVEEEIRFLANAEGNSEARALGEAVFSAACNECGFRNRCYPRFLEAKHVSLAPLLKAELEVVMGAGITTLDALLAAINAGTGNQYGTLLELKESSPLQLRFLREKVQKVLDSGLYSSWRASPVATDRPLFFVSIGNECLFDPPLTAQSQPACLVVYSEGERRRAWAKMREIKNHWGIPAFVLSKEVQQTLHGPIPSLTLLPLAAILKSIKTYEQFQKIYPPEKAGDVDRFNRQMLESKTADHRMALLKIVWDFLQSAAIPFEITPATR